MGRRFVNFLPQKGEGKSRKDINMLKKHLYPCFKQIYSRSLGNVSPLISLQQSHGRGSWQHWVISLHMLQNITNFYTFQTFADYSVFYAVKVCGSFRRSFMSFSETKIEMSIRSVGRADTLFSFIAAISTCWLVVNKHYFILETKP